MNNSVIFMLAVIGGILLMTMLGALGGFFFKKSTGGESIWDIAKSKYLYLGVLFYVLGAVANIFVLKHLEYSIVYPMSSITYIWTMLMSKLILKEKFTKRKFIGITAILIGAFFFGFDGFSKLLA